MQDDDVGRTCFGVPFTLSLLPSQTLETSRKKIKISLIFLSAEREIMEISLERIAKALREKTQTQCQILTFMFLLQCINI